MKLLLFLAAFMLFVVAAFAAGDVWVHVDNPGWLVPAGLACGTLAFIVPERWNW